jgi:LAO/AO transport system kinase
VKNIVDFFLLLLLAGAGDELQGIKKGIVEMADAIVITKADGENIRHATRTQAEFQHALHLTANEENSNRKVLTCSATTNTGIYEIWDFINDTVSEKKATGLFQQKRQQQNLTWFDDLFQQLIKKELESGTGMRSQREQILAELRSDKLSPQSAAEKLLATYHTMVRSGSL